MDRCLVPAVTSFVMKQQQSPVVAMRKAYMINWPTFIAISSRSTWRRPKLSKRPTAARGEFETTLRQAGAVRGRSDADKQSNRWRDESHARWNPCRGKEKGEEDEKSYPMEGWRYRIEWGRWWCIRHRNANDDTEHICDECQRTLKCLEYLVEKKLTIWN